MSYQKSEKCYYMGLKSAVEWTIPDNETCPESKDRYEKVLSVNLRPMAYQRARDNNIKRWLELKDKLQYESPTGYIDKIVLAYLNDEIKITDIFIQSSTSPIRPGAAPERCYILGKRNIIKVKTYQKIENNIGKGNALEALLVCDFGLIFEVYAVDNKCIENFVTNVAHNIISHLIEVSEYWEFNIKRPDAKTSNQQAMKTGIYSDNDSEMYADIDDETEKLDGLEVENYDYTNDNDVQIEEDHTDVYEHCDYSDLTGNLNDLM